MVNTLRQIVKISGTTGTGQTSDHTITPNLLNVDKAFCIIQFRPLNAQDHDGDWKGNAILNTTTLRIYGDDSSNAVPFVAYIIEFDGSSDVVTQQGTLSNVQGGTGPPYNSGTTPATSTLSPAVNLAETMEIGGGHQQTGTDTTIGQEELEAVRLLGTTEWEYDIHANPNSVTPLQFITCVDWNDANVVVQRGVRLMGATSTSTTLVAGSAFNTVDPARSMIICESVNNESNFSPPTDEWALNMEFNGNDIDITRQAQGGNTTTIHWVIVEFPAGFATVDHLVHTMGSGVTSNSDTITALVDFNNAFPMGTTTGGTFSYHGARPSAALTGAGAIDQIMPSADLTSNTNVNFVRDAGGTAIRITYQVVEFLAGVAPRELFQGVLNPSVII